MPLTPGTRLGPYEIVAPLGAGGMGEVFRATDTRLGREVAIKVLPQHLSDNPEVRARFEREAKTVSSLNHPHICTLHDVGREGDTDYLVMELVDGETLAQRLEKGALPPAEALKLGGQIADALDRAHRAGVVHRDLKPGNVMLTKSGAKLMDFGLARATGMAGPASGSGVTIATLTQSPTVASPLTAEGTIVGTFQYMAPEQLEGSEADARSDLWALGCVLYEMATGKRAFEGKSQASLISSIMGSQPASITQLAPMSPPGLDRLVQACLAKDPADRLQSAHDIRMQLAWLAEGGSQAGVPAPVAARRRSRERLAWMLAAAALIVAVALAWITLRPGGPEGSFQASSSEWRTSLALPDGVGIPTLGYNGSASRATLALSPRGDRVAFVGLKDGEGALYLRRFDSFDTVRLTKTEGAAMPFFSPDGTRLAFFARGRLWRIDLPDGVPVELTSSSGTSVGGSWGDDGQIVYAPNYADAIWTIPATGGEARPLTPGGRSATGGHAYFRGARAFCLRSRRRPARPWTTRSSQSRMRRPATIVCSSKAAACRATSTTATWCSRGPGSSMRLRSTSPPAMSVVRQSPCSTMSPPCRPTAPHSATSRARGCSRTWRAGHARLQDAIPGKAPATPGKSSIASIPGCSAPPGCHAISNRPLFKLLAPTTRSG
jgi:tRNA A-37 threonylcarbamoyl transferase component Bud32